MAALKSRTMGQRLRDAADQLIDLAERVDTPPPSLIALQYLHDDIEALAGEIRAVVRGRGFR